MWDIIIIAVVALTPVILVVLYFAEEENSKNKQASVILKVIRKCVTFVLKCLSVLLAGDTKYVTESDRTVRKDMTGVDNA